MRKHKTTSQHTQTGAQRRLSPLRAFTIGAGTIIAIIGASLFPVEWKKTERPRCVGTITNIRRYVTGGMKNHHIYFDVSYTYNVENEVYTHTETIGAWEQLSTFENGQECYVKTLPVIFSPDNPSAGTINIRSGIVFSSVLLVIGSILILVGVTKMFDQSNFS